MYDEYKKFSFFFIWFRSMTAVTGEYRREIEGKEPLFFFAASLFLHPPPSPSSSFFSFSFFGAAGRERLREKVIGSGKEKVHTYD